MVLRGVRKVAEHGPDSNLLNSLPLPQFLQNVPLKVRRPKVTILANTFQLSTRCLCLQVPPELTVLVTRLTAVTKYLTKSLSWPRVCRYSPRCLRRPGGRSGRRLVTWHLNWGSRGGWYWCSTHLLLSVQLSPEAHRLRSLTARVFPLQPNPETSSLTSADN